MAVKQCIGILLGLLLVAGCKTSTVESRKLERQAAYDTLAPEVKQLVDAGQIRIGMPQDAVYIAWGPPSEVLTAETQKGATTTWRYYGSWMQETRYWAYREITRDDRLLLERYLERDYDPRQYVRAEIVFENGVVKEWRTLPRPLSGRQPYY